MSDPRFPIGRFTPPAGDPSGERPARIAEIAEAPAALRRAVRGLDDGQLRTPYRDEGWTVAQVVHHLADSHMNAFVRCKLALTEDRPLVKPYAERLWAGTADATGTDVESSLSLFEGLHHRFAVLLRSLPPEAFGRVFLHPERGEMTIDGTLALYAWHGRHHVAHITQLRERLGW